MPQINHVSYTAKNEKMEEQNNPKESRKKGTIKEKQENMKWKI